MSEVIVISPRENLIEAVAGRVAGRDKDYSKSLVLFPGRRPVHFLYKFLAAKERSSFIPPKAFSIDDLVEFLLKEHLGVDTKRLEPTDAAAILFDIHLRAQPKLGGLLYTTLDAFFPLGIKLVAELEEIALAELPPRKIREALQTVQFPKFHSLWYYYKNFYTEVERRGLTTRSQQYRTVADAMERIDPDSVRINWKSFERIVVAGFYAFTNVERRIMTHLLTLDHASFIFQNGTGLQQQLRHLGIDREEYEHSNSHPISHIPHHDDEPSVQFYQAPDTHGQIFGLASLLRDQQSFDETTVIVLPSSESLFPVVHGALPVVPENNYNISLGYPLKRTPVYGFFNSVVQLVASSFRGEFSPSAYIEFMLHPYVKNLRFGNRSDVTRIIVHTLEDHFEKAGRAIFFSLEALESDGTLAARIKERLSAAGIGATEKDILQHLTTIHDNTIRKFLNFTSVKDCVVKATDVLTYIFQHSTAKLHPYFHPYCERCVEELDRIGKSLLAEKSFADLSGYFAFLRHALEDVTVPFTGTPVEGVQVLGLLETRGLRFNTVYYLDATDDVIPGRPAADLLLPQSIRAMLGLETYRDRDRLKEYYFDLAVQGANKVHLFYTETQEGQKEKSRFVEKLLWKFEQRQKTHSPDAFVSDVRYRMNLANPGPSPVKKTAAMVEFLRNENRFSTSQLDTYLKCPLKFYYQTVLGLREREEISDDVDVMKIGNLVHIILKEYFAPAVGQRLSEKYLTEEFLRDVVERCFEKEYGKELVGPTYFIKQQVMIQLRRFLNNYQKPKLQAEEIVIEDVEMKRDVVKNGFTFSGKIDRVEKHNGETVIIDYKTGSDDKYVKIRPELLDVDDRNSWGEAIGSFQLPMYMMLYSETTGTPVENIVPLYLFLGRNRIDESIEVGLDVTSYRRVEEVMFKLVEQIVDVRIAFEPTRDFDKHCPNCPYNIICGTQWTKEPGE
jgi:ATP-dependent helicase/nuclease subunit B